MSTPITAELLWQIHRTALGGVSAATGDKLPETLNDVKFPAVKLAHWAMALVMARLAGQLDPTIPDGLAIEDSEVVFERIRVEGLLPKPTETIPENIGELVNRVLSPPTAALTNDDGWEQHLRQCKRGVQIAHLFAGEDKAQAAVISVIADLLGMKRAATTPATEPATITIGSLIDRVLNPPTMGMGGGSATEERMQERHKAECAAAIRVAWMNYTDASSRAVLSALCPMVGIEAGDGSVEPSATQPNGVAVFRVGDTNVFFTPDSVGCAGEYGQPTTVTVRICEERKTILGLANQIENCPTRTGMLALAETQPFRCRVSRWSMCDEGERVTYAILSITFVKTANVLPAGSIDLNDMASGLQELAKAGKAFGLDKKQAVAGALLDRIKELVPLAVGCDLRTTAGIESHIQYDKTADIGTLSRAYEAVCEGLAAAAPVPITATLESIAEPVWSHPLDLTLEQLANLCAIRGMKMVPIELASTGVHFSRDGAKPASWFAPAP